MLKIKILTVWWNSITFGVIYAGFVFVLAQWLGHDSIAGSIGDQGRYFAPVGALCAGALSWWLIVAKKEKYSLGRGGCAGFVASVTQYFFGSYAMILYDNLNYWVIQIDFSATLPIDPLRGIISAGMFSLLGNIALGVLCIPAGLILGVATSYVQKKSATHAK